MLEAKKYALDKNNHKAIAREIYDFFKEDTGRISIGKFAIDKFGDVVTSVLSDDVYALCIRGARFRLIGKEPYNGAYQPEEYAFANYLVCNDPDELAGLNNKSPNAMMERLESVLQAA